MSIIPVLHGLMAAGSSAPVDPYWSNVVSLLHFNGAQNSTIFTDQKGKVWTANGTAKIDTAFYKFGGASGQFGGSSANTNFISTPNTADFNFPGDFTIEGYASAPVYGAYRSLFVAGNSSTPGGLSVVINNGFIRVGQNYVADQLDSSATIPSDGSLYHWAVTRAGSTVRIFVNGLLSGSGTFATNYTTTGPTTMGGGVSSNSLQGHLDEVRVTKGVARYTASFSVPTAEFPNS